MKDMGKKETAAEITMLREFPPEEQVDFLLLNCRIDEARNIFNTRVNKKASDHTNLSHKFNIDAAWCQLRNTIDYSEVKNLEKSGIDPRELIMLFKDLVESSSDFKNHAIFSHY